MNKTILTLPLLVLLLIAPAAAEDSAEEKRLNRRIAEVEQALQDTQVLLTSAEDPAKRQLLSRTAVDLQSHLAQLHVDREYLRIARLMSEKARLRPEVQDVDEADLGKFIPDHMRLDAAPGKLAKRLESIKVSIRVDDVSLSQAVALLAGPWEVDVVVDPKAAKTQVSLNVKDVTLHEALKRVGKAADLIVRLDNEVVRLVKPQPYTHKGMGVKARKGVLPPGWGFGWNQPHLEDLRRRLEREKDPAKRTDLEDEIRIREVIERYESNSIPQKDYSSIRVTMRFADAPLSDVATQIAEVHGVEILVPSKFGEHRVSIDLNDRTLPAAIGGIARAAGGIASTSGKGLYVLWPVAVPHPTKSIATAVRPALRFGTASAPTPEEEWQALRDEIRALRAEIAEIKAILLRMRSPSRRNPR